MTQIAGYIALVDFGMSGSVARILVDYKDNRTDGKYGSTVLTSGLVGLVQGSLVLVAGVCLAVFGAGLLKVGKDLQHEFMWLLVGQAAIQASVFWTRTLPLILTAHQRYDVMNYSQMALFAANFAALWAGFAMGFGVYSSLWSQAIVQLLTTGINGWWCVRLGLLPRPGAWGRPTWDRFKELFSFGKDFFLFAVGSQMVNASQAILVTPFLGLEAAGVWSVCTRAYVVVTQLVNRILDYSATPLSEMLVRGENQRFFERFRSITVITASSAVVTGAVFALCNQPFVHLWSKGRFGWSPINDALLGVWLVLISVQRCHCGILGVKKRLGTVKYVYFAEGCVFIGLAALCAPFWGFRGIIGSSIAATLCLSFAFGLWRTKTDFGISWRETLRWLEPAAVLAAFLAPWVIAVSWLSLHLGPVVRLALGGGATGMIAAALLLRWGFDDQTRLWIAGKLPNSLQAVCRAKASQTART
jgi:O-antigen/teichoic acid export membrane protein